MDLKEFEEQNPPEKPARETNPRKTSTIRRDWKQYSILVLLGIFGFVVLVFLYSFLRHTVFSPKVEPSIVQGGKPHVIQLDVLNGTGIPKLGQKFTDYLRARGFDVVEMGNFREKNVAQTHVLDRSGNLAAAEQVAAALGIPKERVGQMIDRNLYIDVTVIVGKDYRSLIPMR
ncbi:MAG: LytR C-terminal domain-containing protein [bacterium]